MPDLAYYDDLVKQGFWAPTPTKQSMDMSRHQCLVGDPVRFEGAGVEGFAASILQSLQQPNAWFASYGGVVDQELYVYAPQKRLAVWVCWAD